MKHNYTIDQIYLFYEKCRKEELDKQRIMAITLAQSFIFATPAYDKNEARKKNQSWKKFIDSFDWEKLTSKNKSIKGLDGKTFERMIVGLGVPINLPEKEEGDTK